MRLRKIRPDIFDRQILVRSTVKGQSFEGSMRLRVNSGFRVRSNTIVVGLVLARLLAFAPLTVRTSVRRQNAGLEIHKPLIIAHRGGAQESTENTIGAFQR